MWIACFTHVVPPAPDRFDRKLGGVVINSDTDPAPIVRQIVNPIGANLAELLVRKIVGTYALRLPLGLVLTSPIGEWTHQFLLLRIH